VSVPSFQSSFEAVSAPWQISPVRCSSAIPVRSLIHSQSRWCSAVCPPRAPPLCHAIAIHLIRMTLRATSLTISIPAPYRGFVLDAAFRMGDALIQCLSNATSSSQVPRFPLPPLPFLCLSSSSLGDETFKCTSHPPAAPFPEYSLFLLTDSFTRRRNTLPLRLRTRSRAVLAPCAGSGCSRGCLALR
jgi:hypothetical protein